MRRCPEERQFSPPAAPYSMFCACSASARSAASDPWPRASRPCCRPWSPAYWLRGSFPGTGNPAAAGAAGVLLARRRLAAAVAQQVAQFFQMRAQSRQLFGHVDAQREQIGFLGQPFGQLGARDVIEAAGKAVSTLSRSLAASFSRCSASNWGRWLSTVSTMRPTPSAHSRIIAARRWPSRSRPSCNCVSACWAACGQAAPRPGDRARRCRAGQAS